MKQKTLIWSFLGVLAIVLVFAGYMFSVASEKPVETAAVQQIAAAGACPDSGLTDFKLDIFNSANSTGSEGIDETVYIFDKDSGVLTATITDTTNPTATDLDCGRNFVAKAVSTSGASGDQSMFDSVTGGAEIVDGNLEFSTTRGTLNLRAQTEQHASLNCRAYDNNQNAFIYDNADASNTDYETDGVVWMSTTSNTTKSDETLGMDIEFQCKAVESDTDYNDRGILVLLEMPTAKWQDTPMVYVNGQALSKITLEGPEKIAYTDYEYAYLIPADVVAKDGSEGFTVRVVNDLLSGVTSVTADPEIDFAPRGSALQTDGQDVLVGSAVTDASTPAQIHTLFDMSVDMT